MATLLLQGLAGTGDRYPQVSDRELTGRLIDYAALLGINQGFSPRDTSTVQWQINDAGSAPTSAQDPCSEYRWVQFSLPTGIQAPPFAGLLALLAPALTENGSLTPISYTLLADTREATYLEPEGETYFQHCSAPEQEIEIAIGLPAQAEPAHLAAFLEGIAGSLDPLMEGIEVGGSRAGASAVESPEHSSLTWGKELTVAGRVPGAPAASAGAIFNRVFWELQNRRYRAPFYVTVGYSLEL